MGIKIVVAFHGESVVIPGPSAYSVWSEVIKRRADVAPSHKINWSGRSRFVVKTLVPSAGDEAFRAQSDILVLSLPLRCQFHDAVRSADIPRWAGDRLVFAALSFRYRELRSSYRPLLSARR